MFEILGCLTTYVEQSGAYRDRTTGGAATPLIDAKQKESQKPYTQMLMERSMVSTLPTRPRCETIG